MPDHLHVLLQGESGDSDLLDFVRHFKQLTGFHLKRKPGDIVWQQSFFDRVLKDDADAVSTSDYIFDNPVKERLVEDRARYKWVGGKYLE